MFKTVLKLQLLWVVLGLIYNLVSLVRGATSHSALAPTDPVAGIVFMLIAGAIILLGFKGLKRLYISLASILGVMLAYSGVYLHYAAFAADIDLPGYASVGSWGAAVLINVYGVLMLLAGVLLALRKSIPAN